MINSSESGQHPLLVLLTAMVVTGAVLGGLYARANLDGHVEESALMRVDTRNVSRSRDLSVDHWYAGRIEPRQQLQVASELAGKVERVLVDEGDVVSAGDTLIELDTAMLRADRKRLVASLAGTSADSGLAQRRLGRQRDLEVRGFSTGDAIDEIETRLKQLASRRSILLAELERIDIQLAKSVMRAPFEASIQHRLTDVGAVVSPGTPMLELLQTGSGEIKVGVPVDVASDIRPGQRHRVVIRGLDAEAEVISVAPAVDRVTQTVAVRLLLEGDHFRFGEYVNLRFTTRDDRDGFWVPGTALVEDERGLWSLYALDAEGRIDKHAASIVHADNERAFVDVAGRDDLTIVVSGLSRVSPGMTVAR